MRKGAGRNETSCPHFLFVFGNFLVPWPEISMVYTAYITTKSALWGSILMGFFSFILEFFAEIAHERKILGIYSFEQRRVPRLVRNKNFLEFPLFDEIFHQAMKIPVSGDNDSLLVIPVFHHRMQHEFRITIPLRCAVLVRQGRLENENESGFLKSSIQWGIPFEISKKKKCFLKQAKISERIRKTKYSQSK